MTRSAQAVRDKAILLWLLAAPVLAATGPLATISSDANGVSWTPAIRTAGVTLVVAAPNGIVQSFSFAADELPTLSLTDVHGQVLADGTYTWELRILLPASKPSGTILGESGEEPDRVWASQHRPMASQSGHFTVAGGLVLLPGADEAADSIEAKDQVVSDDLIVDGKGCIGLGCNNNEAFGSEALVLKQSVVRLRFADTSTAPGFPTTDWQLRANDAGSGGANLFSIEDLSAGTVPVTVEGSAPSSSLYISQTGNVGVGTAVPQTAVHVVRNASPSVTLEQTGAPARQWQLIGSGTSFTLRDNTAGTTPLVVGTTIVGTVDAGDAGGGSARPGNSAAIEVLRHDTDCTLLGSPGAGFKPGELCYEKDSDRLFACEPTDGVCDSPGEWRVTASGAGLTVREVDGTPSVALSASPIVELDQADGFAVSASAGGARIDWSPQADQIALGTHTTGNYAGSSSEGGPATTASALAADPADCAAGQWAAGIAANGVAAGCTPDDDTPDSDAEVPDAITVTGTVDAKDVGTGTSRPANGATIQLLRHDTNCTSLSGSFKAGETCFEKGSNRLFVCKPTAGDCDTPSEWVLVSDGALGRLVNWGFTPDESWAQGADEISWTGFATYTGFVTPAFPTYSASTYQVSHNNGVKSAFRYRPAATSTGIALRARTAITFVTSGGVMIDDGVDAGDGNGARNFYRVYMTQAVLAGPMTVIEEYRVGGGAVVTNVGPTVPYGEFVGVGLRCVSGVFWSSYPCSPFTFGESQQPVQFTGGSPAFSWTPVRVGLYAKFSMADGGRKAIWDWYDEATN